MRSFVNAGFTATIYSADGEAIVAAAVPMLTITGMDIQVMREEGGVPLVVGAFTGTIPLTENIPNAAQVLVRSLRRGVETAYDLVEADDDEADWTTRLTLTRRELPIGVR